MKGKSSSQRTAGGRHSCLCVESLLSLLPCLSSLVAEAHPSKAPAGAVAVAGARAGASASAGQRAASGGGSGELLPAMEPGEVRDGRTGDGTGVATGAPQLPCKDPVEVRQ